MSVRNHRKAALDAVMQGAQFTDARYILVGAASIQFFHTNGKLLQPPPEDIIAIREGLTASLDKGRMRAYRKRAFDLQPWRAYRFAQLSPTEKTVRYVLAAAKEAGTVTLISAGWDPGLFSLNRLYATAILPEGKDYTFWGRGVSQGHSDAVRRIPGVKDCRQYTVPVPEALDRVRNGENPELTTREKHTRYCYVVAEEGADLSAIEQQIVTMPNYFADYDTTVHFITEEELERDHSGIPHGGVVIRSGVTGLNKDNKHTVEFSLKLDSNPEFTASVILAYARAAYKLSQKGEFGCKTVFDIPPAYLSPKSAEELRAKLL